MMIETHHKTIHASAADMSSVADASVDLIVTSPPYPMIEMWDESFSGQDDEAAGALANGDGPVAFERMHLVLDVVWAEVFRVMKPGGIACVNIGDATRTINGEFRLYPNHVRIAQKMLELGFSNLPNILWRKQTNAPNKFMGSGMLAPGAYVTLEHEYILIFRKGDKRVFESDQVRKRRAESAYFWEERNVWFSDVWDFKGTGQQLANEAGRDRSGAFPFELPYRLINMFSVKGDTVLDPFAGIGTTALAAVASARNSVGYELDPSLAQTAAKNLSAADIQVLNNRIRSRFVAHAEFVQSRKAQRGEGAFKHRNVFFGFPVMTSQEKHLFLQFVKSIHPTDAFTVKATHTTEPVLDYQGEGTLFPMGEGDYTEERRKLFEGLTLDQIVEEMRRARVRDTE